MMRKVVMIMIFLVFCLQGFVSAQEDDGTNKGKGFAVTLDMSVDAFNFSRWTYGASDLRGGKNQDHSEIRYLISNWEFAKDAAASLEYNSDSFGGKFGFQPKIVSGDWTFGAKLSGWAQFSFLRLTLGNDIETNYADWQGSDEGLMIYNGTGFENPDNITNSNGLLAEAFFKPFTFAVAAGNFSSVWNNLVKSIATADDYLYKDRYDTGFHYGARIGYEFGELGKVNASYKIYYNSVADRFNIPGGNNSDLEAYRADAEVFEHLFGLYTSMYFLNKTLGLTVAYLGDATVYLSEYYNNVAMVETAVPVIYKNGIALNARWNTTMGMTLRMENTFSFWQDKDYDIFNTGRDWNMNVKDKKIADDYALIDHFVLRSGLGVNYFFTEKMNGGVFVQDIFKRWSASDYVLTENTARVEFGLTYNFNPNALVFVKLDFAYTVKSQSAALNAMYLNYFLPTYLNKKPDPVATDDTVFTVRIPIGITLKIQ